jgi:hypothetical protein
MHTFNNVITDFLNSIRPSYSGNDPGLYYKHSNRTYSSSVAAQCIEENISPEIQKNFIPTYVLTKAACLDIDVGMKRVLGAYTSEEVCPFIMRGGGAQKSHDTIFWAHTFAQWCLRDLSPQCSNMLHILECMAGLNSSTLHLPLVENSIFPYLVSELTIREGFVPPSECCVTLHELIHCCQQVSEVGLCRHSTLYKFERVNKLMKHYVKNKAKGSCIRLLLFTAPYCFLLLLTAAYCFLLFYCFLLLFTADYCF